MTVNDAWGAVAELAASQHGVFHRSQAADLLLTNKQLAGLEQRGTTRRLDRDIFAVTAAPASWHQGLFAASLAGLVISHRSAAELHGFDGFSAGSRFIHASSERQVGYKTLHLGKRSLAPHKIVGLVPHMIALVNKIRVTNAAVTLAMLGLELSAEKLEQALDSVLRKGASERWILESTVELRQLRFHGARHLAKLLDQSGRAGPVPESWFERRLANMLRAAGLPPLQLQHQVGQFRIDGAWNDRPSWPSRFVPSMKPGSISSVWPPPETSYGVSAHMGAGANKGCARGLSGLAQTAEPGA
jgi:hypothetical protein